MDVSYFVGKESNLHEKVIIGKFDKYKVFSKDSTVVFDLNDLDIEGDVVIDCWASWTLSTECLFRYSFHTAFINDTTVICKKDDLDETYKK